METTRKFKYDDGTVYTQGATPKPSTSSVAQPQQPIIPVSVVDGTTPSVDIPQAQTPAIPTPYSISDIFQNQSKALSDQQAALQKQRDPYVAQMQSLLGGQMNMGNDYLSALNSAGVNDQQNQLQRDLERLSTLEQRSRDMQTAFDKQLSDMELRGASSDITKGTYNAQASRASREFSFQQRAVASQIEAQAAIVQAKQGNIKAATDHIQYMLKLRYDGTESALEQERYFLDKIDDQLSANQEEQSDLRKQQLEFQLDEIKQAKQDVKDAVATGGASAEEIARMSDPNITPAEQSFLAQQVIARTAASDRAFERYQVNQSFALRGEELQLARDKFEAESSTFGSGTITLENGDKAVVTADGQVTPLSEIDFDDPAQIDALPISDITKAVMGGYAKTKDLTPTDKSKVAAELAKIGFNPNTYITNKLDALVQTWASVPETSRGYIEGLKFWESKTNADVATFESQRTLLTREIARLFDVGVLSDQDVQAYKDAMPSRQDADISVVLSKAAGISGAATGSNTNNVGTYVQLADGRTAVVGLDGDTLLDPKTGKPI